MSEIDLPDFTTVSKCRSCDGPLLSLLSLGRTPLANSLLPAGEDTQEAVRYPLDLVRCAECSLVQLAQIVPPSRLFSDYVYFSSYSSTMLQHAERFVSQLVEREHLGPGSFVVELASNDGYLLQFLELRGIEVLGIEPATNIAHVAQNDKGIPTLARFFTAALANELTEAGRQADVVIGNNVLAHVPSPNDFVAGVALLLGPEGTASFEVPYLKDMLDRVEFDTIYHEHQCYYSVTALVRLFARHGLEIWNLQRLPIHGGSIRIWAAHAGTRMHSDVVTTLLAEEREWGVTEARPYEAFATAVADLKLDLLEVLDAAKHRGGRIAAYGAAAKGVTLTSFCGVGRQYLDFVVDRSPHKQGKRFPVDDLPIEPPSALVERRPDYTLLLTWNFADEILQQQAAYRALGGTFIVPVPNPRLVPP